MAKYLDKTLVKGLKVIEILAGSSGARGISELSRELDFTKSNVHRVLTTLVETGFARKKPGTEGYELTLKLWELGSVVLSRLDLRESAVDELRKLAKLTGENVFLSVFDGSEVLFIHKIESDHPVRSYMGGRSPAYCSSTGKAMLAHMPADVIERVAADLQPFTLNTITTESRLEEELALVRSRGFAINCGEWHEGVHGVGAPIRGNSGEVVAAVGISGPAERMPPAMLNEFGNFVVASAARISFELGYRPPSPGQI